MIVKETKATENTEYKPQIAFTDLGCEDRWREAISFKNLR
jgi:hypothetical protein